MELESQHAGGVSEDPAVTLYESGIFKNSLKMLRQTVKKMREAGSKYKNLEARLGSGTALVLGNGMRER